MELRVGLCLALLAVFSQGQRISERKCQQFRELTITKAKFIPLTVDPKPITVESFNCSKTTDLIVGGEVAKRNEFPHQALLGWSTPDGYRDYKFDCGGSLISLRYVLTAAHCFKNGDPDIVRLGEHNIDDDTDHQVDLEIEEIVRHPEHKFSFSYHDIALIKLKQDVRLSKVIRPACLCTGQNTDASSLIATGFGNLESAGNGSTLLRKVVLEFMDKTLCEKLFTGRRFRDGLLDAQLCIGSKDGGRDTCQGDSGGPIQVNLEPKGCTYHVTAITSLGPQSCGNSPALYTQVASYIDWIEGIVWKDEK